MGFKLRFPISRGRSFEEKVLDALDILINQGEKIMAGIDDFNKSLVDLAAAITRISTDITAALAILTAEGSSDAQFEQASQTIESSVTQLNAAAAQLEGAEAPPASPATAPPASPATPAATS